MKQTLTALALSAALAGCASFEKPALTSITEAKTSYVIDGIQLSDRPVVQETAILASGPFEFVGFSSYSTKSGKTDEVDAFLSATHSFGDVDVTATYGRLTFPTTGLPDSDRVSVQAGYAGFGLKGIQDIKNRSGLHKGTQFIGSYGTHLFDAGSMSVDGRLEAGYLDRFYSSEKGFSHVGASVTGTLPLSDSVSLKLSLSATQSLDKKISAHDRGATLGLVVDF